MPEVSPEQVAAKLAEVYGDVDGISQVLDYEPLATGELPLVSVMFSGFLRSGLESPAVSGSPIRDPLGGRSWVWLFNTRLWIALVGDERSAQVQLQELAKRVVLAVEADRSLGGIADDTSISNGVVEVVRPPAGNPMLLVTMQTEVETTEAQ